MCKNCWNSSVEVKVQLIKMVLKNTIVNCREQWHYHFEYVGKAIKCWSEQLREVASIFCKKGTSRCSIDVGSQQNLGGFVAQPTDTHSFCSQKAFTSEVGHAVISTLFKVECVENTSSTKDECVQNWQCASQWTGWFAVDTSHADWQWNKTCSGCLICYFKCRRLFLLYVVFLCFMWFYNVNKLCLSSVFY